jgi:hypothetical protein
MLGNVIGAEARAVVLLGEVQARREEIGERSAVIVDVVENPELERHERLPLFPYRTAAFGRVQDKEG